MSCMKYSSGNIIAPVMFLEDEKQSLEDNGDKRTIEYINEHFEDVRNVISNCVRRSSIKGMSEEDINDILIEVIEYFYEHDDYIISKAYNEEEMNIVPISGYVSKISQFCTLRYIHKFCKERSKRVYQTAEGRELYESIPDESVTRLFNIVEDRDVESYLKELEPIRYKYCSEIDIYQFLYIRILCANWSTAKTDKFIAFFNLTRRELNEIGAKICKDVIVNDLKGAMMCDMVKTIRLLKGYIYGVEDIDRLARAL